MSFKAFFDGPDNYQGKFNFYAQGSSPKLLEHIISIIEENRDELLEVNLCWYLFNNKSLHEFFKEISTSGIKVNIVTIPLEGYDASNPKSLLDLHTHKELEPPVTKYDLAKDIFKEVYKSNAYPNYNIYFFPHLYVRSKRVKKFSRGKLPYSMHLKAAYLKKKNGCIIALSSSNLAVRDLVKYESMVLIEDEPKYQENLSRLFSDMINNSIPIRDYDSSYNKSCNTYSFIETSNDVNSFFTAPFYFDSANVLEETLIDLINRAENRIVICAQHLAAFNYNFDASFHSKRAENEKRKGILGAIIEKAQRGVKTTCISQTFAPTENMANEFRNVEFRQPANTRYFRQFYEQLSKTENASYYVNENLHSKYIIIDDLLVFCTYNFTPTQFSFLDNVYIEKFDEMPIESYKGIHCEVAGHLVISDKNTVQAFMANADLISNSAETIRVL